MALLTVSGISKENVLTNISFSQRKLQKIAVVGETGSGKTTLLKIISGMEQPDRGDVFLEQNRVEGPLEKLVPGHPGIAYLSQQFELQKFLRVEQILSYANTLSYDEANTLYDVCQINHLLTRKTDQLSGGEKQRIAMARLLITSPKLLLLDEPFTHLDSVHKNTLKSVINDISKKLKISCILVSHDPADTLPWADKILVMKDGKILQQGSSEKIYKRPVNEYVAGLFGKYNVFSSEPSRNAITRAGGIKLKRKKLLIRPEGFKLAPKGPKVIKGTVSRVNFFGRHYEIEVSALETTIIVNTVNNNLTEGGTIYLSISRDEVWFV